MSWLFSRALVEEYLVDISLDGEQSALLSGSHIQQAYCVPDKMTDFSRLSRFGMMYKPLTESLGEELLMSYLAAFPAKTSQSLEKEQESKENEAACGEKWRGSFTKFDPNMSLWKTHQCSLVGDLEPFLETWPQWGLMRNGECWEQQTLEQTIRGTESGLWLPTPCTVDSGSYFNRSKSSGAALRPTLGAMAKYDLWPTPRSCSAMAATITPDSAWNEKRNPNLETIVGQRMWPTPTSHNAKETNAPSEALRNTPTLAAQAGGQLNPVWVEWLMGWPLGWTDLKPLVTDKSLSVPQQPGGF
jgi:hypothetical protein